MELQEALMSDLETGPRVRRFDVHLTSEQIEQVSQPRLRTLIRNGAVNATTRVRESGAADWMFAGDLDEFRADLDAVAMHRAGRGNPVPEERISRRRLVAYMALAGLVAGGVLFVLGPICLLVGIFAKFVIDWAAFGAVIALGLTNALKIEEPRILYTTAAGFAGGGLVAWLLHGSSSEFSGVQLAIIGLAGGAALSHAIRMPLRKAAMVTVAAMILFPIAIWAIPRFAPITMRLSASGPLVYLVFAISMFLPMLPFAVFGGVIGSLISWSNE
jgi:hypothetical protein